MAAKPTVLHIFAQLRRGGPVNALIGLVQRRKSGTSFAHRLLSLKPVDPLAARAAAAAGIVVESVAAADAVRERIAAADIVQLHFWNNPDIHALLRSPLPPMRAVAWCHVSGSTAPHILPQALFDFTDMVVATSPHSLELPCFRRSPPDRVACIPPGIDPTRFAPLAREPHDGFVVGYVGVIDHIKLHPRFLEMSLAAGIPDAHFLLAGDGADRPGLVREAARAGAAARFEFAGHATDMRAIHARLDILGYPLCPQTSATSDLAVQEAMCAGIPPVLLPHGGPASLIVNGETGLIAASETDYGPCLAALHADRALRERLGRNAARYARDHFDAELCAAKFEALYDALMARPKRERAAGDDLPDHRAGSAALIRSLDSIGDDDFVQSLTSGTESAADAADQRIAAASPGFADLIFQYRMHYPDDGFLRYWCGMVLAHKGRHALAGAEFKASLSRGGPAARAARGLAASRRAPPANAGAGPAA